MMPTLKIYLLLISMFVITVVAGLSPQSIHSAQADNGLLVLSYHDISDAPTTNFSVSEETFKAHMGFLKHAGYHFISLESLGGWWDGSIKLPPRSVLVTFDDGNRSDYDTAFPILKEYGFPGNLFLLSDPVAYRASSLSTRHIKEMSQSGFAMGSHGVSHQSLVGLDAATLRSEIRGSKKQLESGFGRKIHFFAYPYGNFDAIVAEAVKSSGYQGAFTTIPGINYRNTNPFELRRVVVGRQFSLEIFKKAVNGDKVLYTNLLKGQTSWNMKRGLFRAARICIDELLDLAQEKMSAHETLSAKDFAARAYNKMGAILMRLGLFDEAKRHFAKAVALKPDFFEAHKNLDLASRKANTSN
jgi:peptidoglycan/xylan/chitin deacetylase (PgdA/CDA1 family)